MAAARWWGVSYLLVASVIVVFSDTKCTTGRGAT
jgi:hypothetical protein